MFPAPNAPLAVLRPSTDSMPQYYDSLEARDPKERERLLMAALPGQIAHAKRKAPGWARILADVDPAGVTAAPHWQGLRSRASPISRGCKEPSARSAP